MRVLISGSGIAGTTLAYFLAKAGVNVTIVEKVSALLPHGQNIDMKGSAITVIKKMGLFEELKRLNTTETGTQFIDPKGRPFACFPIEKNTTISLTSEFEILRGDLAAMLYNASKDNPNTTYLFSTTIDRVISDDIDGIKVKLSNGQELTFDLLVAADGQWSKIRKQCFPRESIQIIDMDQYSVYYTVPRLPIDNDFCNIYLALDSKIISIRPDPHGTVRVMFSCMPCNAVQRQVWQKTARSDRKTQQELLKIEFSEAGWQAKRFLDSVDESPDFYFQAIQQVKMARWSTSRIVCLGDAAFAPTPLTGMGSSLAITGAYILAGEIAKLDEEEHPSTALNAYELAFRPFVEQSQEIFSIFPSIAHPKTALKRWLSQACLSFISKVVAKIVATPLLARRFETNGEERNDGFPLPEYASLN